MWAAHVAICIQALLFWTTLVSGVDIQVLYLGDPHGSSPYFAIAGEPGITLTPIPSFTMANSYPRELGGRIMRSYFPRSHSSILKYDAFILSDVRLDLLTPENVDWMASAVVEGGKGLAMIGGLDSFTGVGGNSWFNSSLGPLLPISGGRHEWSTARLVWVDEADPFISTLPFNEIGGHGVFSGYNEVATNPGARAIAKIGSEKGTFPLMVYWKVGEGICFTFASEWKGDSYAAFCRTPQECHLRGTKWGNQFAAWEYSQDFARNIVYLMADRPFPETQLTHYFRSRMEEYGLRRSLAMLQIEFLDKLSVPSEGLVATISKADSEVDDAKNLYVSGSLEDSIPKLDKAIAILSTAGPEATRLKKSHLPWIYLSQYSVVSATALVIALVLERVMSGTKRRRPKA